MGQPSCLQSSATALGRDVLERKRKGRDAPSRLKEYAGWYSGVYVRGRPFEERILHSWMGGCDLIKKQTNVDGGMGGGGQPFEYIPGHGCGLGGLGGAYATVLTPTTL